MDETLSALIAFVGFLIVFSMLIQSVQEALKNLFKLKSGVWERFFLNLYRTDFKKKSSLRGEPFWQRVQKGEFVGEFEQRLLRLKNITIKLDDLIKEVKKSLQEIIDLEDGRVAEKTEKLYEKMTLIKGLKIETILELYEKNLLAMAENDNANNQSGPPFETQNSGPITKFAEKFKTIYIGLESWQELKPDVIKHKCNDLLTVIEGIEKILPTYRHQIENKVDAWLVQLQGEYKKNMLKWTIFISIAAVVLLNADAFTVYKHFSVDTNAQKIMFQSVESSVKAVNEMREKDINSIHSFLKEDQLNTAKAKMISMSEQFIKEFSVLRDTQNETNTNVILTSLTKNKLVSEDEQRQLQTNFDELTGLFMKLQKSSIDYHISNISATGLPLGWSVDRNKFKDTQGLEILPFCLKKVLGLILTIFLVSFGAPFWQNIMSALVGIKNISKKQEASPV